MELDLNRVLQVIRRWWWLLLIGPLLGGATAWYVSEQQPEMYASEVTLLVSAGVGTTNVGSVQASQDLTETYSQWAVARPVLERSVEILDYDGTVDDLAEATSARVVPDTLFIEIAAQAEDPKRAATIANTVADQFLLDVQQQTAAQQAQVRGNVDATMKETSDRLAEVQDRIDDLQADANRSDAERDELATLMDEEAMLQGDLAQLETTIRTIDVELASAQTRIVILSPAVASEAPFAPNTLRATAIGIVSGIALTVAAVIMLEYFDDTIRDREELSRTAGVPVLAGVGSLPDPKRGSRPLFVLDHPASAAAEAMRLLRANLEFASAPHRLRSLAISSSQPEEGKSTITANLGVVMAQAGLKTVIVDADLRHPSQHKAFGVENRRGLSTLLVTPDPNWREGTTPLRIPNLALITSGPIPPNPADLLSLDRFAMILASLGEWADVVLIDTPPVLTSSDALIIATKADGLLLVCRHGVTRRGALRRATGTLQHAHARLMGVVLNQTRSDEIDHYGRYGDSNHAMIAQGSAYVDSMAVEPQAPGGNGKVRTPTQTVREGQ